MIVLDASVLIGHLNRDDFHHGLAEELLSGLDPIEPLGASVISLAEAMAGPAAVGDLNVARQAIERLGVGEIGWWEGAALLLAKLRATTRLKMPDCCVLAAAEHVGGRIATFDGALARAAGEHGIAVIG